MPRLTDAAVAAVLALRRRHDDLEAMLAELVAELDAGLVHHETREAARRLLRSVDYGTAANLEQPTQ